MPYKAILVRREPRSGVQVSEEVLQRLAQDFMTKGTIDVRDPDGELHPCTIVEITVTPKGIEAVLDLSRQARP